MPVGDAMFSLSTIAGLAWRCPSKPASIMIRAQSPLTISQIPFPYTTFVYIIYGTPAMTDACWWYDRQQTADGQVQTGFGGEEVHGSDARAGVGPVDYRRKQEVSLGLRLRDAEIVVLRVGGKCSVSIIFYIRAI